VWFAGGWGNRDDSPENVHRRRRLTPQLRAHHVTPEPLDNSPENPTITDFNR